MTEGADAAIGIIIVAHGRLGEILLHVSETILGPLEDCVSIRVEEPSEVEKAVGRLNDAAQRLDKGNGVLILTDMFGGTPTNLALSLLSKHKVELVTGVNMPMLLKAFEARAQMDLQSLAEAAEAAGKTGIVVTGAMLRSRAKNK